MTGPNVEVILDRLRAQDHVLEQIQNDAAETKQQVKLTNGRVTKLELWRAELRGAARTMSWVPTVGSGVVIGVIVAAASRLLG